MLKSFMMFWKYRKCKCAMLYLWWLVWLHGFTLELCMLVLMEPHVGLLQAGLYGATHRTLRTVRSSYHAVCNEESALWS